MNRILFVNGQVFDGTGTPAVPADVVVRGDRIERVGDHGASYGLDPGRVFGWGDSAGGHLALLAALTGGTVHGAVGFLRTVTPGGAGR